MDATPCVTAVLDTPVPAHSIDEFLEKRRTKILEPTLP
jgi:hypothetical protein